MNLSEAEANYRGQTINSDISLKKGKYIFFNSTIRLSIMNQTIENKFLKHFISAFRYFLLEKNEWSSFNLHKYKFHMT